VLLVGCNYEQIPNADVGNPSADSMGNDAMNEVTDEVTDEESHAYALDMEYAPSSPLNSQSPLENTVNMEVTSIDESHIVVTIINNSNYEIIASSHFTVEYFDGTDWRQVPWYGEFEGVFIDLGFDILPNDSLDFTKNLGLVEALNQGQYRIRKVVFRVIDTPISNSDLHDVTAEFYK
jgi:hypothetical protein